MSLTLDVQRRDKKTGKVIVEPAKFDPKHLAIVLIDFWDWHWCKTASVRAGAMVWRINRALECLRKLGVQVILCPTDVADSYVGTPQRERALACPLSPLPEPLKLNWLGPRGGDCMCGPGLKCECEFGWKGMNPTLVIGDYDLVIRGNEELYANCKERGITDLIYFGLHTNMCVMGKPCGIKPAAEMGLRCMLARDVTDACTEYDPSRGYTPDDGTAEVVRHIERHIVPTVHIVDEMRKAGLWDDEWIVEPVRCAPWGERLRPHLFEKPFKATLTIPWLDGAEVRYTEDGSEPTGKSKLYSKPLPIEKSAIIRAAAFKDGRQVSRENEFFFAKLIARPPMPDVHCSDLRPYRVTCPGDNVNSPRFDKTFHFKQLKLRRVKYDKGIGMHAPSQVMYELKREYDRFVGLAGIDEKILLDCYGADFAAYPNVIFSVYIDGELAAHSPCMRITEEPWRFDVKIPSGSRLISLSAAPATDNNHLDYGNWVNVGFVTKK